MISEETVQANVTRELVEEACQSDPTLDPATVEAKISEIFGEIKRQKAARKGVHITDEQIQARGDCLIFFDLIMFGWGKAIRLPSGAVVAVDAPASFDERRGLPTRYRLWTASKRVRQTCPEEAAQYKRAWRDWREARRRLMATETEESWQWYRAGDGNRNSVAYRSRVDLSRRGGEKHFRTRRLFKYTISELLPRMEERQRAHQEWLEAESVMREMKKRIYEKMGVPPEFRE